MSKDTGGCAPAFPIRDMNEHPGPIGLTMRDYFAAKALSCRFDWGDKDAPFNEVAQDCYRMADAMLAERAK